MRLLAMLVIHIIIPIMLLSCWTVNLYKFTQCDFKPSYKAEIVYGLGIFIPIFPITVWADFGK